MKSKEKDTLRSETQDEPKSKEQVLTFSHQLRREIETACRQLIQLHIFFELFL